MVIAIAPRVRVRSHNNLLRRFVIMRKKTYLCKMNMNKLLYIALLCSMSFMACNNAPEDDNKGAQEVAVDNILVEVDGAVLTRDEFLRDMPNGWVGEDSLIFAKMYVDNWVLKQLKMRRASDVLPTYEESIERLVEDYRQSLIMRQLDQYYIDADITHNVTDKQIAEYYKTHASKFKLSHNVVKGVIVKVPETFENTKTLKTALSEVRSSGSLLELMALAEKLSLDVTDLTNKWYTYSDFLGYLPTVRTRNYDNLLSITTPQHIPSDDAIFYFIFTDVVRAGSVSPFELVEEDIMRRMYAERRAEIVYQYEQELRREAVADDRILFHDNNLEQLMDYSTRLSAQDENDDMIDIVVQEVEESDVEMEISNN